MQEGRGAQGPAAEGDRDSRDGRDPRACRHRCGQREECGLMTITDTYQAFAEVPPSWVFSSICYSRVNLRLRDGTTCLRSHHGWRPVTLCCHVCLTPNLPWQRLLCAISAGRGSVVPRSRVSGRATGHLPQAPQIPAEAASGMGVRRLAPTWCVPSALGFWILSNHTMGVHGTSHPENAVSVPIPQKERSCAWSLQH